jgi:N12 class adenine-specific DNA methylase
MLIAVQITKAQKVIGEVASIDNKKSTIVFPERERIKTKAQLAREEEEKLKIQQDNLVKENQVYTSNQVDAMPEFIEGQVKLEAFLSKTLKGDIPLQQNAPNGLYKVILNFVVNKDGSVGGIKPLTAFGFGMEKEAIRVVSKTNNMWKSATINNKAVHCEKQITISFNISNE